MIPESERGICLYCGDGPTAGGAAKGCLIALERSADDDTRVWAHRICWASHVLDDKELPPAASRIVTNWRGAVHHKAA